MAGDDKKSKDNPDLMKDLPDDQLRELQQELSDSDKKEG